MAGNVVVVSDANFEDEIIKSDMVALVDFWAAWCAPCRAIAPIVEELSVEYAGKVKIANLNVDDNPKTSTKYRIMSIPALLIFKKGTPIEQIIGVRPKEDIKKYLDKHLVG